MSAAVSEEATRQLIQPVSHCEVTASSWPRTAAALCGLVALSALAGLCGSCHWESPPPLQALLAICLFVVVVAAAAGAIDHLQDVRTSCSKAQACSVG